MNNLRNGLSWLRCNDDTVSHGGKSRVSAEKATDFPVLWSGIPGSGWLRILLLSQFDAAGNAPQGNVPKIMQGGPYVP